MEISLQLVQLLVFCNVEEYLYLFMVCLATILVFWANSVEEHQSGYMDTESEPRTFEHGAIDHFFFHGH
jgi:hypothetical protein